MSITVGKHLSIGSISSIFGREMRGNLRFFCFLLLLFASCAAGPPAEAEPVAPAVQGWGIRELMQALQQVKLASSRFVERKYMHVLTQPLVASGTLLYVAPDQVQKVTLSPTWERLALAGDTLTIEGGAGGRRRTLSLAQNPEIAAFVEGVRATLAGDLPALQQFYKVSLSGNAADWQLSLVPKDTKLQELVKSIRIAGSGDMIHQVTTEDADGDHSDMSIVETSR